MSVLPGIGSLEARLIRGWRLLTARVSLSSQSATSYWVMFHTNSFPKASENRLVVPCDIFTF